MATTDAFRAVALRGRLGNHLFHYALGRALTPEGPVVIDDLMRTTVSLGEALRPGEFRSMTSREALAVRQVPVIPRRRYIGKKLKKTARGGAATWLAGRQYIERQEGVVDPRVFAAQGPIVFQGYFQHEDYFMDVADRIAAAFAPPLPLYDERLASLRADVGAGPTVAVVVRAGLDYEVLEWAQRYVWYRRAAERVTSLIGSPRFAVFSDIPLAAEAVAASFSDLGPSAPMTHLDPVTQLHLIASMDHAVVSASSFAWWGAWLGDQQRGFTGDRVVVAPDPWVRADLHDTPSKRWLREPS